MSRTYSIYQAKAQLSAMLRLVKKGAEVVVTERGVPVARVIPFVREETMQQKLKRLVASGILRPRKNRKLLPVGRRRPGGLRRFLEERE